MTRQEVAELSEVRVVELEEIADVLATLPLKLIRIAGEQVVARFIRFGVRPSLTMTGLELEVQV